MMTMLRVLPWDPRFPDWDYQIDGAQVGVTSDGRLLAYDV